MYTSPRIKLNVIKQTENHMDMVTEKNKQKNTRQKNPNQNTNQTNKTQIKQFQFSTEFCISLPNIRSKC